MYVTHQKHCHSSYVLQYGSPPPPHPPPPHFKEEKPGGWLGLHPPLRRGRSWCAMVRPRAQNYNCSASFKRQKHKRHKDRRSWCSLMGSHAQNHNCWLEFKKTKNTKIQRKNNRLSLTGKLVKFNQTANTGTAMLSRQIVCYDHTSQPQRTRTCHECIGDENNDDIENNWNENCW